MSKTNALIVKARGLNTQPNELDVPEGSLRVAENVEITRDHVVQVSPGFADYSSNLPDFEPQQLFAYGGTLYAHHDDGIWYHDGTNWLRKRARFGQPLDSPAGMVLSGSTLYMADSGKHVIWSIDLTTGARTVLAGRFGVSGATNGTGDAARFNQPMGLALSGGVLYVSENSNHVIRKVTTAGVVTTLAGSLGAGSGDVDSATAANVRFTNPQWICALGTSLYVADKGTGKVKAVTISSGATTTIHTEADFDFTPVAITTDGTDLYVCTASESDPFQESEIRKVTTAGVKTTLLTMPGACGSIYWDSTSSRLLVGCNSLSFFYIYKVTTAGVATAFIGSGTSGTSDGKASNSTSGTVSVCSVGLIRGFAADANTVYFCQGGGGAAALRKVYRAIEYVTTLVGTGSTYTTGPNAPAEKIDAMILGPD